MVFLYRGDSFPQDLYNILHRENFTASQHRGLRGRQGAFI